LIWTTSTPVWTGKDITELAPWTTRAIARNQIAEKYIRKVGVPIDDLYSAVLHHPEYYRGVDGTHPNERGRAAEARNVADSILQVLGK
jgi:lysophospholipase L1-like esterase